MTGAAPFQGEETQARAVAFHPGTTENRRCGPTDGCAVALPKHVDHYNFMTDADRSRGHLMNKTRPPEQCTLLPSLRRLVFVSLMIPVAAASLHRAAARSIDSCLIGTWEATSVSILAETGRHANGGQGFRVTFEADGTQRIDYSTMTPFRWPDPHDDIQMWRGSAIIRISTADQTALIEEVKATHAEVSISKGNPFLPMGWGPGVLGSSQDNAYACTAEGLRYRTASNYSAGKQLAQPQFAVELMRMKSSAPSSPEVAINGRTWLTETEIKDRRQDLSGVWFKQSDTGLEAHWIEVTPAGRLYDNLLAQRGTDATSIDMLAAGKPRWRGHVYVCPRPKGTCPNLCRWTNGSLETDALNLLIEGEWHDKQSKLDCSGFNNEPDSGNFELRRLVGVSFVPIARGKYLNLIGAPAVGNQAAQFKAAVRIAAHYDTVLAATIRARADRGTISLADKAKGLYNFVADQAGVYELTFELVDGKGQVFHTDRMRVDIPGIPGLGK
jgi:hypothetical protein